ncbi:MAG: hypothetical protein LQ344_003354 [Seirophora lacunosa]|nr:MAG: hypothetical protein LQ344_003354 [Seirophora lacunosa]
MPVFINPFKKADVSDFEGVYVPLANSQRHHSVVAAYEDRKNSLNDDNFDEKKLESPPDLGNQVYSANTVEGLRAEIELEQPASGHDTAYDRKSKVINKAITDIGMGRYQWELFVLCGFGWLADNMWLQGLALTLPGLTSEFGPSETNVRYTTCALFIGLCLGASVWGVASDVIGRRLAFNATLFLAGVFGLAVGGGNSWVGTCALFACVGVGVGGNAEAVATVHGIAYKNKRTTWLSEDVLNEIGGLADVEDKHKLSKKEIVNRNLSKFSTERIAPLFATRKLALMTLLIWFCWTTIGMGYPLFNAFLPQYLANSNAEQPTAPSIIYRNYAITSVVGVPGSILAAYTVNVKYIGRKGTIAISTLITGVLVFCFTISSDPNFQLAFTCLEALFQNIMYGVLTPEVFPAPNRGTGTGIASCLNRIAGLCAPIVAVNAGQTDPKAPIYASGGLFLAAFVAMCFFPIETRDHQSL